MLCLEVKVMNRFNDRWEDDMRREVPRSADYVKAKLAMELEIYRKGYASSNSAINDSINKIEGNIGAQASNEKRLVRTMESPSNGAVSFDRTNDNGSYSPNYNSYNSYNNGMSFDDNGGKNFFGSGYSTVLILCFTACLIFLVFLVCLLFANYF